MSLRLTENCYRRAISKCSILRGSWGLIMYLNSLLLSTSTLSANFDVYDGWKIMYNSAVLIYP